MPACKKSLKGPFRLALVLAATAAVSPVFGSVVTVTNLSESGAGSLRDAITNAASGDSILFQQGLTGTIFLAGTALTINKNLTITGPGGSGVAISGGGLSQVFIISSNTPPTDIPPIVTFSGLTILSGNANEGNGGGIQNNGTLTVVNSIFVQNTAACGGGIYNAGQLTVLNSTFYANGAIATGGCFPAGGGINNSGEAFISNSTFVKNGAPAGYGGGISNIDSKGGPITIKSTLFSNNTSKFGGNCFFTGSATSDGYNLSDDGSCSFFLDGAGERTSVPLFNAIGDINSVPSGLDPRGVENNGGPMQTAALFPGSPAIDAIPAASCTDVNGAAVTTDQRGFARPQGAGCDIGAYELVPVVQPLTNRGTVEAWGDDAQGELGNSSTTNSNTPVAANTPPSSVAAVAGGSGSAGGIGKFSVALDTAGAVWTWGNNQQGQLGNGSNTSASTPAQVSGLSGVTAITAGGGHGLTLLNNGTVWGWGLNSSGELGNSTTTNSNIPVEVNGSEGLINVGTIGAVTAVAAGDSHSLAVLIDGSVWAWGDNSEGELGNGSTTSSSIPGVVNGVSGVTAVAAGLTYSLALKSDGTVWAWGENSAGQLGNGSTTNSSTPVQVSGLTGVTAIAASNAHSVALLNDGTVRAWGDNSKGALGNGSDTNSSTPVQVSGLSGVSAIGAGANHSLALKSDGTVWAWGGNGVGQLGNGSNTNSNTPVQVSSLSDARGIAGGGLFSLALASPAPTANPQSISTNENSVLAPVPLTASSATACDLTFSIVAPPANGTLGGIIDNPCSAGSPNTDSAAVMYTPNNLYAGPDSFTFKVNDGLFDSAPATVSITVNALQSQTIAVTAPSPVPASATYGSSFTVTATGGDSGNPVTIGGAGSCSGSGNNSVSITMSSGSGNCTITLNQAGNGNYLAATQVVETVAAQLVPLTVTASSTTVSYGSAVPAISASINGFVNQENASVLSEQPVCGTTYTPTSGAGSAQTTNCSGASAANYSFNYVGGTVTVNQATATVGLSNLSQPYTGSQISPTVMTNPTGLAVMLTYNGNSSAPSAVGQYNVVATINDPNYTGSATGALTITAVNSTIAITGGYTVTQLGDGQYQMTLKLTNTGNATASTVSVSAWTLGSAAAAGLPLSTTNLAPGASVTFVDNFPASVGKPGSKVVMRYSGTYPGGSFASSGAVTLP